MDRDGDKSGYDLELLRLVSETVKIPLIASGGAGSLENIKDAFLKGKADASLAASIFHFGEISILDCKKYLQKQGILIRI